MIYECTENAMVFKVLYFKGHEQNRESFTPR
jgi:hypothetical protein